MQLLVFAILIFFTANATEKSNPSKIDKVTVFQQGAQVNRKASIQLKKGRTELVFTKLSPNIDANSIQVSGKGDYIILSVFHRFNYLDQIETDKNIKLMMDSIIWLDKKIYYLGKMKLVYDREYELLNQNRDASGQNGLDVESLKKLADFFRSRMTDVQMKYADLEYEIQDFNKRKGILQNQINAMSQNRGNSVSEIVVEVDAPNDVNGNMEINYLVTNAGWYPSYDLRAIDINNPMTLQYRANVYQNSGEDWDNIKLVISTGNPRKNGTIPTLYTWYLQYRNVYAENRKTLAYQAAPVKMKAEVDYESNATPTTLESVVISKNSVNAGGTYQWTTVNNEQTNTLFEINIPYSIPSSGKQIKVEIQSLKINANYRYYCVPKLDPSVFLEAMVTGWEDFNLLSGNMNVFFEGTYVGNSYLNAQDLDDTLSISLGRDENFVVKRTKIKDKNSKSLLGSSKTENTIWEITVRNGKDYDVKVIVEDQIPLSNTKEIVIETKELNGGNLDEKTGKIKWRIDIPKKTSSSIKFGYSIKYPKDWVITNKE